MSEININQNNFQSEVLNSHQKVLLDFWSPRCIPCRTVNPLVHQIARERSDIKVGKVNVDEEEALAGQFNIRSIPTFLVMEQGKVLHRTAGAKTKKELLGML